ncbi:MAG TPA: calcium-translocating P-type ATPase, PMCA-type [Candidatus Ozemobacteraceae bacterium]|nr:calcium-translocating P-type ATPase, PMCA-type [Candidatus Ozemobacteraceae bacterium]
MKTTRSGLTEQQVLESRRRHGANVMTPPERDPWWKLWLEKFDDPIIRILMIAAGIAIVVGLVDGTYLEGIGILIAIFLATTLAFINEFKAGREFDILNQTSEEVAVKVIRDGGFRTVPRKDIVVDDLVLLEAGDEVPADGILLEAVSLQIDEARLTGESVPVTKRTIETGEPAARESEALSEAYEPFRVLRSTMVADGRGLMQATSVGDGTEIGRTARAAAEETGEETPLNRQLERLSKVIGVIGFGVAALTFAALIGRDFLAGELPLTWQQWVFALLLGGSVMASLVRIWIPIVGDAYHLAGRPFEPPSLLKEEGMLAWLKTFGLGLAMFAVGLVPLYLLGLIPAAPAQWLPLHAVEEFLHFFMIAVTIVVVAVPEGLAMSVTLSLAYSMRRMTAANNLVRRMHACETIGAATVICSDKTGTLTQNRMTVGGLHAPWLADGAGVKKGLPSKPEKLFAEAIAVNSTANLDMSDPAKPVTIGNPTEGALLSWLAGNGCEYLRLREAFKLEYQWTFSTERKFMATLGVSGIDGATVLYVKGAPEIILERSERLLTPTGIVPINSHRGSIQTRLKEQQARGMRTLAIAARPGLPASSERKLQTLAVDLVWLGFVSISDPIRPEVPGALNACREAGVRVKIITGDTSATALEIARQAGLFEGEPPAGAHMTGPEFAALDPVRAARAVEPLLVLSRARPADKMRAVKLLQQNSHVVAVTGDGTNDAPALNHANVGLAMGMTGTAVAKEASDIILLDDSFPSVVNGIMWGRSLYGNIQRFVLFQLTINIVALGIAFFGPFIGTKLPLTVIQMLWVNLIMDTFAALALATEPPHRSVMKVPPRKPEDFIVTSVMARQIFGVGGIFLVALLGLLIYMQGDGMTPRELTVFFSVFILLQFWNLFNARCLGLDQSAFRGLRNNRAFVFIAVAILIGQILIVQFGGSIFRTVPLSALDWLLILAVTSPVLIVGELIRWYHRSSRSAPRPPAGGGLPADPYASA